MKNSSKYKIDTLYLRAWLWYVYHYRIHFLNEKIAFRHFCVALITIVSFSFPEYFVLPLAFGVCCYDKKHSFTQSQDESYYDDDEYDDDYDAPYRYYSRYV